MKSNPAFMAAMDAYMAEYPVRTTAERPGYIMLVNFPAGDRDMIMSGWSLGHPALGYWTDGLDRSLG